MSVGLHLRSFELVNAVPSDRRAVISDVVTDPDGVITKSRCIEAMPTVPVGRAYRISADVRWVAGGRWTTVCGPEPASSGDSDLVTVCPGAVHRMGVLTQRRFRGRRGMSCTDR